MSTLWDTTNGMMLRAAFVLEKSRDGTATSDQQMRILRNFGAVPTSLSVAPAEEEIEAQLIADDVASWLRSMVDSIDFVFRVSAPELCTSRIPVPERAGGGTAAEKHLSGYVSYESLAMSIWIVSLRVTLILKFTAFRS